HLTSLPNRAVAEEELARRMEYPSRCVAVLMVDLDHFKRINDTLGHAAGDVVLQQIGRRLSSVIRGDDLVARLGGDEFLLLTDLVEQDKPHVGGIANRLLEAMNQPFQVEGKSMELHLSVGVAYSHDHGNDAATLMRHADMALYAAKEQGRRCCVVYNPAMESEMQESVHLEDQLKTAIAENQLRLFYQPKVDLPSGRVIGLEALVRWQHPQRGLLGPDTFISEAERNNLINPLGRWVIDEAARQIAQWRNAGQPAWPVAVNVSFAQIVGGTLVDDVARSLQQHGVAPDMIEVELTESVVMANTQETIQTLHTLTKMGLSVALDDFGTGYSSLAYVRQLPLDSLKIDRSFVNNLETDLQSQVVTNGIIGLARGLKLKSIAEGVETAVQRDWLKENGCDIAQGYLFSRPVPAIDLPAVVAGIEGDNAR
ncbi:MAG: EAL domain-containing protein, partial [Betaproteobacteria bacterium]